jgi:hypothetical protein
MLILLVQSESWIHKISPQQTEIGAAFGIHYEPEDRYLPDSDPDDNGYDSPEDEDSDASDDMDDGMSSPGEELDSDEREDQKFDEEDQDTKDTINRDDEASGEESEDNAVDEDRSTPHYVLDVSGGGRQRSI